MAEIWLQHLETMYDVSDIGRVRNRKTGRVMKLGTTKKGYMRWICMHNGKRITTMVHRAVAIAFIANPNQYETVDHIENQEKSNNRVENLRWANQSMQMRNQCIRGEIPFKGVTKVGEKYRAQIRIDAKKVNLGTFVSPEEASQAYNTRFSASGFDI